MYQFPFDQVESLFHELWCRTYDLSLSTAVHVSCLLYMAWLVCIRMVINVLGLSSSYISLTIGKSLSFPMLLSNGTALNLIPSIIDSINVCFLTQLVSVWESILRQVQRCISSRLIIGLIVMSCVPIFTPHTNLTVF